MPTLKWNPRTDARPSIRYVDVSGVSRDDLRIVTASEYAAADAPGRARKIVKRGDTIFATVRPTLRRVAQVPECLDGEVVSTAFCVLRTNPDLIHPDFLFFAMQMDGVMDEVASTQTGASYPAVRDVDVLSLTVPVPPISVQCRIAAALNLVRAAILRQRGCGEAATALKRAAMQTLFTRGLRGEAQRETEIGPVPESWEISPLGYLCSDTDTVDMRLEGESEIEYVDVSSISREFLRIESSSRHILKDAPGRARKRILAGDVIFATVRPTLLRTATVPPELNNQVCSTAFCVLRRKETRTASNFLHCLVQRDEFVRQLAAIETGASYPAVTDRTVKEQTVPVPSFGEQQEIAAILDAIDRKIDLHRRKQAVLEELFKALLHKLMTGEVRVGELDIRGNSESASRSKLVGTRKDS